MYKTEDNTAIAVTQVASVAETRISRPLLHRVSVESPVRFSLAYARQYGVTDAVLLYHLQLTTCHPEAHIKRTKGKEWLAGYSLNSFLRDLPCFNNIQTISKGLQRLGARDAIDTDYTGELWDFPTGNYSFGGAPRWNKATDGVGWYAVNNFTTLPTDLIIIDADDAREHGTLKACVLSKFYAATADRGGWKKLSASELAVVLPFSRVKIQDALTEMHKDDGLLVRHPSKPKLYNRVLESKPVPNRQPMSESYGFFDL